MRSEIVVAAPAERVYEFAAATERWGRILPHYRYVRVLAQDGEQRVVEMAAWRGCIPVRWRAQQRNDARTPQVLFTHISGWARGMQVAWHFEPLPGGRTRVSIEHVLHSPLAPIIGRYFVDPIAARTLRRMKELAEGQ